MLMADALLVLTSLSSSQLVMHRDGWLKLLSNSPDWRLSFAIFLPNTLSRATLSFCSAFLSHVFFSDGITGRTRHSLSLSECGNIKLDKIQHMGLTKESLGREERNKNKMVLVAMGVIWKIQGWEKGRSKALPGVGVNVASQKRSLSLWNKKLPDRQVREGHSEPWKKQKLLRKSRNYGKAIVFWKPVSRNNGKDTGYMEVTLLAH